MDANSFSSNFDAHVCCIVEFTFVCHVQLCEQFGGGRVDVLRAVDRLLLYICESTPNCLMSEQDSD
jgi:hypothetical protein